MKSGELLPTAPDDLVSCDTQPHLAPLRAILDEEERVAVGDFGAWVRH